MNKPTITFLNGSDDISTLNDNQHLVICEFYRKDINSLNVASALNKLLPLTDRPDLFVHLKDRLAITVEGYDDDPRELYQIPEVKDYFCLLAKHWPYWLHYCNAEVGTLGLFVAITSSDSEILNQNSVNGLTSTSVETSSEFMLNQIQGVVRLALHHKTNNMVDYENFIIKRIERIFL